MAGKARTEAALEAELARAAAFRTALRRFLRRTEAVTAEAGLTSQRYDLLLMIRSAGDRNGEVRVSDLYELLQLQQTAVTELVKRAEEAELIQRRPSSEDGRVWLLRPTAEGEARMLEAFEALRDDRVALAKVFRELGARFRATTR